VNDLEIIRAEGLKALKEKLGSRHDKIYTNVATVKGITQRKEPKF